MSDTKQVEEARSRLREAVWYAIRAWHQGGIGMHTNDGAYTQRRIEAGAKVNAALDALVLFERADARQAMIGRCFGQRDPDGGAMLFVVRVRGLGAMPESPSSIAGKLALLWSGSWPEVWRSNTLEVSVAEDLIAEAEHELQAAMDAEKGDAG